MSRRSRPGADQRSCRFGKTQGQCACQVGAGGGLEPIPGSLCCPRSRRECLVTWDCGVPVVTTRARRGPAVSDAVRIQRGPGPRAWKARPAGPFTPEATPMPQVRRSWHGPLLTVNDREIPVLRGGHGRRERSWLGRGCDGHRLDRRVRPVRGDHLPRWQALRRRARQLLLRCPSPPPIQAAPARP
jgi:hypothetical protein